MVDRKQVGGLLGGGKGTKQLLNVNECRVFLSNEIVLEFDVGGGCTVL